MPNKLQRHRYPRGLSRLLLLRAHPRASFYPRPGPVHIRSSSRILPLELHPTRSSPFVSKVRTRICACPLAPRTDTCIRPLLTLLCYHPHTCRRLPLLLEMVLQEIILHCGGHGHRGRRAGIVTHWKIHVVSRGRGELVRAVIAWGPLPGRSLVN